MYANRGRALRRRMNVCEVQVLFLFVFIFKVDFRYGVFGAQKVASPHKLLTFPSSSHIEEVSRENFSFPPTENEKKKNIVKRISLEKREYRPNSAVLSPRYGLRTPSSSYLMQMTHLCWWIYIFLFRSLPSSSSKLTSPFPVAEQKLERTNTFVYMLKQQHWFAHTISTIVLISDFNFSGILFMLHMNKDRWWTYHRQKPQSASRGSNRRKQRNHGLHIELGMPNGKNLSAPIYIRMSLIVDVKFFLGERMDTVWWHDNVKHMLKQCSIETSPHALTSQLGSILARRSET